MSVSSESTRTRLIREMARDMNRVRNISGSSRGHARSANAQDSTGSSFDPENEAVVSTRNIETYSQRLPELRDSAKKYRYPRGVEPEVQINTSAIHRAFPDFSQGPSSDNGSVSIEMSRGVPADDNNRAREFSLELSSDFNPQVFNARKFKPEQPQPLQYSRTDRVDGYTHVSNTDNITHISQSTQQPPGAFSSAKDLIHRLNSGNAGNVESRKRTGDSSHGNNNDNNTTHQSGETDGIPNISELVSGVFEDGTPVFSAISARNGYQVPQNRRKSKLSHVELASIPTPDDEQAIYISLKLLQEKVSALETRKVENGAAIATLKAENEALRHRNKRSDSALGSTSGSDGGEEAGFGVRKAAIEKSRLESRLQRVQNELKESNDKNVVSMETIQIITHERDAATNQLGIAYLTTERLKAQIKALVDENEYLKAQMSIAQGGSFSRKDGMSDSGPTASAAAPTRTIETDGQDYIELLDFDINRVENRPSSRLSGHPNQPMARARIDRVERPISDVQRRGATEPPAAEHNHVRDARKAASRRDATDRNSSGQVPVRKPFQAFYGEPRPASQVTASDRKISYGPKTRIVLEEYPPNKAVNGSSKHDAAAQANVTEEHRATKSGPVFADELPGDFTVLSSDPSIGLFPEVREILEFSRRQRKLRKEQERQGTAQEAQTAQNDVGSTVRRRQSANVPELNARELRKRYSAPGDTMASAAKSDLTGHSKASSNARRHSDHSLLEEQSRRKGFAMQDMTSAYIVPDITIRNNTVAPGPKDGTKKQPERGIDRHLKNCDICHRILEHGKPHEHKKATKVSIHKPVPASERMPLPSPSNPDPTMRPSESPGLSLARVIKSLDDEITILNEKLKELETASYQHDSGMSKHQRVERERTITTLRKQKNSKSDQVYYLMNVLEGQKVAGQEMTEEQVEVTLSSIGINTAQLHLPVDEIEDEDVDVAVDESIAAADDEEDWESESAIQRHFQSYKTTLKSALKKPVPQSRQPLHPWDNLDDTDGLPWEGFESTGEATSRSHRSTGSRRGSRVSV